MKKNTANKLVSTAVAVISTIAALVVIHQYIDWRVKEILQSDEISSEIAQKIRPAIVFDENEAILADLGGLQFIEKITVIKGMKHDMPERIIVKPRNFLAQEPLLTCLDQFWFTTKARRGEGITWVYEIDSSGHGRIETIRFRLEVLK